MNLFFKKKLFLIISNIFSERLTVQAEIGQIVTGSVSFHSESIITMIQGFDLVQNGNGGRIVAVGGGISVQNVTLIFNSQLNQMIDFDIEIYGR